MFHWDPTLRDVLFTLTRNDAEVAHRLAMDGMRLAQRSRFITSLLGAYTYQHPNLRTKVLGMTFPSPVGVAAGLDKNAEAIWALAALGAGFVEIGTVTGRAQKGNPRPRMFRLPQDRALINRMGFNNDGADAVADRLVKYFARYGRPKIPVGISIGKSKTTDLDDAPKDYTHSHASLYDFADYFAVNVSSPNTPGLRKLQEPEHLERIVGAMKHQDPHLARFRNRKPVPILLKFAPDLEDEAARDAVRVGIKLGVDGYIVANTTIKRDGLVTDIDEKGGLSGPPCFDRALDMVRLVAAETGGDVPIIAVGGIRSPDDVLAMADAGAWLFQVYTEFVYAGPRFFKHMNDGLTYEWFDRKSRFETL